MEQILQYIRSEKEYYTEQIKNVEQLHQLTKEIKYYYAKLKYQCVINELDRIIQNTKLKKLIKPQKLLKWNCSNFTQTLRKKQDKQEKQSF